MSWVCSRAARLNETGGRSHRGRSTDQRNFDRRSGQLKARKIIDRAAKHDTIFVPLREHLEGVVGVPTLAAARDILEFGAGRNGFIEYYTGANQNGHALDIADISGCYEPRIKAVISDGRTIPLPDASIDLVVSHSVVEHVGDLPHSLGELNRVLRPGGLAYITVSPLYFSPNGSHRKDWPAWDHLNPASPNYLTQYPLGRGDNVGSFLNKLRADEFKAMVDSLPWETLSWWTRKIAADTQLPDFLGASGVSQHDLTTKEFRYVGRKRVAA